MLARDKTVKKHWEPLARHLQKLDEKGLSEKQLEIDWQLKENGVTYNIYDGQEKSRKWNLDPIPFILENEEWQSLKKGIAQRAKLFDLIFKDIYGEQKLLKEGIVPAEVLYLDSHYIREVQGFDPSYFNLNYYAADLSRGPTGKFWIVSDKTESPSGLGYAIENRLTLNNVNNDFIQDIKIHKISEFIDGFKQSLYKQTTSSEPVIIMLSPGPYNETYFEQSYLSSILNCELVRGEDLLVKDANLYLKSLSGLKKIDIIIRRVDDRFCDPLELRNDSQLGVPGLLDVLRQGNVVMINPIGVGILENLALNPFMNNICKYFFNESLLIPQIATWWCGQKKERNYVLEHFDDLIIKSIDKRDPEKMYVCSNLDEDQKGLLKSKIEQNPYRFIAQEKIEFSTIPAFTGEDVEARKNSLRIFSYKDENEYHIMNGGLVRISSNKDVFIVSNQKGGGSKDLWVLSDQEDSGVPSIFNHFAIVNYDISIASLTTKKAENLFWLGRYLQRSIITARILRLYLKYHINNHRSENAEVVLEALKLYEKALTHLTMTYPGFFHEGIKEKQEINSILKDVSRVGSLSFTISMVSNVNVHVKNLLSNECWKVYEKLETIWFKHANSRKINFRAHAEALDQLLIYLSAYKELIRESISNEQGLIFYRVGSRVEMAMLFISKMRSLLTVKYSKNIEYEVLQFILYSYEGFNAYKTLYKSNMGLQSVVEFLLIQKNYSKSLYSIIASLVELLQTINNDENIKSPFKESEKHIYDILNKLERLEISSLVYECDEQYVYSELDSYLNDITELLTKFSNEFTKNYFSHYYE